MQETIRDSNRKGKLNAGITAIALACALCGHNQSVLAAPGDTETLAAQSGVAMTQPVHTKDAVLTTPQTSTVQTAAAAPAVAPSAVKQAATAPPVTAPPVTAAAITAQSGVAQTVVTEAAKPAVAAATSATPAETGPATPDATAAPPQETIPEPVKISLPPKKKIVFTQFDVANPSQVSDIDNIYDGLPAAISSRIEEGNRFLATASRYSIPEGDEIARQQAIMQIAAQSGAQFVVAGTVVDAGTSGITRNVEVELTVYDGFTGTKMLSRRFDSYTSGADLQVGHDLPFGSGTFYDTNFGSAIYRVINYAARGIGNVLLSAPFAAHIVRINGKEVLLDAGKNSLLKPGYQLVAYTGKPRNRVTNLFGAGLGDDERPADVITLTRVQPEFSIGLISHDAGALGISAGDVARISDADRRYLADHPPVVRKVAPVKPVAMEVPASPPEVLQSAGVTQSPGVTQSRATKLKTVTPTVLHKAGIVRVSARKKRTAATLAKASACQQLAALRAACEKETAAKLKLPDRKI